MQRRAGLVVLVLVGGLGGAATAAPKIKVCGQTVEATATELLCEDGPSMRGKGLANAAKLTALTKVVLRNASFDTASVDLAPLAKLPLKELRLDRVKASLAPLAKITTLEVLHVSSGLYSKPPAALPSVLTAKLEQVEEIDLALLPAMTNLRDLTIYSRSKDILDTIAKLPLKKLELHGFGQQDKGVSLAPLAKLATLEELKLESSYLADLTGVGSFADLRVLDVKLQNSFSGPLPKLPPKLEVLHVEGEITDINALSATTALRELRVWGTYKSLAPLAKLSQLRTLRVGSDDLQLDGLAKLTGLEELIVYARNATKLPRLDALTHLRSIEAYLPRVGSLAGIAKLPALQKLRWQYGSGPDSNVNALTSLAGLETVPTLEELSIANTAITDLSALAGHKGIKKLDLSSTDMKVVTLSNMPVLESVNLEYSQVEKVDFKNLPKLASINLANTSVTDVQSLLALPGLQSVRVGNPKIPKDQLDALKKKTSVSY